MPDLKRYIINEGLALNKDITITGLQHNHIVNVMRHNTGDSVILLCGDGFDYTGEITQITKKEVLVRIKEKNENRRRTKCSLTVACGFLKGGGNETQAVKCSELGAAEFLPFVSENCAVKRDSAKPDRLRRIADESSKQCKRAIPMSVTEIFDFKGMLNYIKGFDIKIFAYENENINTLKKALSGVNADGKIAVIIGPEGGFSQKEAELAKSSGCKSVTLGRTVLKADTAAVACASAVLCLLGEWDT